MRLRITYTATAFAFLWSHFTLANQCKSTRDCDALPKPENVVTVPPYAEERPCESTPLKEKLQYEGVDDAPSPLREKTSGEEIKLGARYPETSELYVDPEPDFIATRETIVETEGQADNLTPKP